VTLPPSSDDNFRSVCRAIVGNDQFEMFVGAIYHTVEAFLDKSFVVVYANQY
jgi:hypothetical protein